MNAEWQRVQLHGGPDPREPVPRTPVHGVDLPTCGRVAGALARREAPRAATLARFGLDEARWAEVEKTWMLRVAAALLQQDLSLSREYDDAFAAGRSGVEAPAGSP